MDASITSSIFRPAGNTFKLLVKWVVALLVPVVVFNVWSGESILNAVISPGTVALGISADLSTRLQAAAFTAIFFFLVILLTGYLVASDSGRRSIFELWIDILIFVMVPLVLVILFGLIIGLALCAIVWPVYFYIRNRIRKAINYVPPPPLASLKTLDDEQRVALKNRAVAGSFWFATVLALVLFVVDVIYFATGSLNTSLFIGAIARTIILPVLGYLLGQASAWIALRRTLPAKEGANGNNGKSANENGTGRVSRIRRLQALSESRAREEVKDIVPNDLPLRSTGSQQFFLLLLLVFVIFYPVLDPFLFGYGTDGRLSGYGDAGFYVILALGLNIVVGFAGLLDLGYVAFFAIGTYAWGMVGSTQLSLLTGIPVNLALLPWFFWPMLLGSALIAAFFGVLLGAPTLRLRGDYLAIVTLGFGEIVPIVILEMDKYTNGTNGLIGIASPAFPGVDWSTSAPYYYLILALIALSILANVRLRDSRLGRAWVAIREDEIAAASSGVNLVNTKLFAFAAGAFFAGVAGAYHAAKLGGASPDNFGFGDSVIYLAMVVIGGIGSIPGVIVGALVVYAINQFILAQLDTLAADPTSVVYPVHNAIVQVIPSFTFGNIRNLIFGIILIVVMVFRPEGLIPSARRRRELHHGNDEEVEVGSLDVPPGAPGFEAEVHVE